MIFQAKERANKVNDELKKAEDLLASIEDALDARDAELQMTKDLEVQRREAQAAAADAKVRAEQAEEEQRKLEKAARKAKRKAEKKAEKERLQRQMEEREEEERRAAMYPISKTSQAQGGRLVSCVGAEEEEEENFSHLAIPAAPKAPEEVTSSPMEMRKEDLFEQIKDETRETFVSYLCASLPSALLKKYPAEQLLACFQTLLQELRGFLARHALPDVKDEEPTGVAEELRQGSPEGWLDYLQSISSVALRQRFDLVELVDTFQALSQTCFDRLTDELGPLSLWVLEDSLLYVSSPAPPPSWPAPVHEEPPASSSTLPDSSEVPPPPLPPERTRLSTAPASRPAASRTTPTVRAPVFDATLGPAPWEMETSGLGPAIPSTGRVSTGRGSLRPGTQVAGSLLSR